MNENERKELIEAQAKAASALEDGAKFSAKVGNLVAGMVASKRAAMEQPIRPEVKALGVQIANPSAFWSGAAVLQFSADGDRGMAEPLAMATKYAAARLAAGDLDFVRESLLGQAQWCGVLAVKLAQNADAEVKLDRSVSLLKMALQAQRQSAAALATAAALNKLESADSVTVGG
jgi:hypothetical protein